VAGKLAKWLSAARLVRVRAEAQRRIYRLDPVGLGEVGRWLLGVNRVWGSRTVDSPPLPVSAWCKLDALDCGRRRFD
jgi:hypothetical protein